MAKEPSKQPAPRRAEIPATRIPAAIKKLQQRLTECRVTAAAVGCESHDEPSGMAVALTTKLNATYDDVLGRDSVEAFEGRMTPPQFLSKSMYETDAGEFLSASARLEARLVAHIETLQEKA